MTLAANLAALARRLVGTSANNLVALDDAAKLPAVDGAQLTGVGRKLISTASVSAVASADIALPSGYSKFEIDLLGHTGNNVLYARVRRTGDGAVLAGSADYKQIAQVRATGVITGNYSSGANVFRLNYTNISWLDALISLDNIAGLFEMHGWASGNELTAIGRIQSAGPYDLLRLQPDTGTLTCTCRLFGIKDAS